MPYLAQEHSRECTKHSRELPGLKPPKHDPGPNLPGNPKPYPPESTVILPGGLGGGRARELPSRMHPPGSGHTRALHGGAICPYIPPRRNR